MIISDIVLKRKCPTVDVTMDGRVKITDICIHNLAQFADFLKDDFRQNLLAIKTDIDILPHIILTSSPHNCISKLTTQDIGCEINLSVFTEEHPTQLQTKLNKLLMYIESLPSGEEGFMLGTVPIDVRRYSLIDATHNIYITSELSDDIQEAVRIVLNEGGTTISLDDIVVNTYLSLEIDTKNTVSMCSEMKLVIVPLVRDYDDWLVIDMDDYTLYDLEEEKE